MNQFFWFKFSCLEAWAFSFTFFICAHGFYDLIEYVDYCVKSKKFIRILIVGPMIANATAKQENLGTILGSDKVLLGFSNRNYLVPASLDLCPVDFNRLAPITCDLKKT